MPIPDAHLGRFEQALDPRLQVIRVRVRVSVRVRIRVGVWLGCG